VAGVSDALGVDTGKRAKSMNQICPLLSAARLLGCSAARLHTNTIGEQL
jgi:hypothetical protein